MVAKKKYEDKTKNLDKVRVSVTFVYEQHIKVGTRFFLNKMLMWQ